MNLEWMNVLLQGPWSIAGAPFHPLLLKCDVWAMTDGWAMTVHLDVFSASLFSTLELKQKQAKRRMPGNRATVLLLLCLSLCLCRCIFFPIIVIQWWSKLYLFPLGRILSLTNESPWGANFQGHFECKIISFFQYMRSSLFLKIIFVEKLRDC